MAFTMSDRIVVRAVARREEEHGTFYPASPDIDLPKKDVTIEALAMIADRWRRRLKASDVALFEVRGTGTADENVMILQTKGWDA